VNLLYRIFDNTTWNGEADPVMDTFQVIKETPCGVWIHPDPDSDKKRFVRLHAFKQWAWETPEQARESYLRRKAKQIAILKARLKKAESFYKAAAVPGFKPGQSHAGFSLLGQ